MVFMKNKADYQENTHNHKRLKGFQFCKCGKYMGIPRKFLTMKQFKKKFDITQDEAYMNQRGFCNSCGNKLEDGRCNTCTNIFKCKIK